MERQGPRDPAAFGRDGWASSMARASAQSDVVGKFSFHRPGMGGAGAGTKLRTSRRRRRGIRGPVGAKARTGKHGARFFPSEVTTAPIWISDGSLRAMPAWLDLRAFPNRNPHAWGRQSKRSGFSGPIRAPDNSAAVGSGLDLHQAGKAFPWERPRWQQGRWLPRVTIGRLPAAEKEGFQNLELVNIRGGGARSAQPGPKAWRATHRGLTGACSA